jgi:hypothetical protein
MASKLEMSVSDVDVKYPQFRSDRLKFEKRVILESLQWRVDNPTAKNLSVRKKSIKTYFPYLDDEAVRTVQSAFRAKFYDHKDDTDYAKYWNEPALSQVFSSIEKTSNAITRALFDVDTPDGFVARRGIMPAEIVNTIEVNYNGLVYRGRLKCEDHFYAIIDAVRNY